MPQASRLFAATSWVVHIATVLAIGLAGLLMLATAALMAASLGMFNIPLPDSVTHGVPLPLVMMTAALLVVACTLVVAMASIALVLVGRIVASASAGDPFVIKNANRLNVIGGLLLAMQAVGLVAGAFVAALPKQWGIHLDFGFDVSLTGLFTALLVFVLAQIFKRGSEMRAELEGTI